MSRKVAWLFVWTTLTYWLGCGENRNARVEEHEPFDAPASVQLASDAASPSLRGLDRSHWARTRIPEVDGTVPHHPYYFKRAYFSDIWSSTPDRPSPLYRQSMTSEPSFNAATADDRDRFRLGDLGDLILAPTKYTLDLMTLPGRAVVIDRPWEFQTSPRESSPKKPSP